MGGETQPRELEIRPVSNLKWTNGILGNGIDASSGQVGGGRGVSRMTDGLWLQTPRLTVRHGWRSRRRAGGWGRHFFQTPPTAFHAWLWMLRIV